MVSSLKFKNHYSAISNLQKSLLIEDCGCPIVDWRLTISEFLSMNLISKEIPLCLPLPSQGRGSSGGAKRTPFWILLFLFLSCQSNQLTHTPLTAKTNYNLSYQSDNQLIHSLLTANPKTQKLNLQLSIINSSSSPITIQHAEVEIQTSEGIRSAPLPDSASQTIIPPHSVEKLDLFYEPINDLFLHRTIQFKGDLEKEYLLPFNFIKNEEGKVVFEDTLFFQMEDRFFQNYLTDYGNESSLQLFKMEDQTVPGQPEIRNPEIHWQNVHSQLNLWRIKDTLNFSIRIFNQAEKTLALNPEKMALNINDITFTPSLSNKKQPDISSQGQNWLLRKGSRFAYTFQYMVSEEFEEIIWQPNALFWIKSSTPLLEKEVIFRKKAVAGP